MEAYVLAVQLIAGGHVERIPVHDCDQGVVWIREAWRWAKRSGVDDTQPIYVCYPATPRIEVVSR